MRVSWFGIVRRDGGALTRVATLCVASLALAGCGTGILDPRGPVSSAERVLLFNALTIMLMIVVPVIVATMAFAWWFRASNTKARFRPEFTYSGRVELVVWGIPALTVMFLGGLIWISAHALDPAEPLGTKKPLDIQVVSLDWKWLFIYPDQNVATVNQLVIPAGTPVRFALTSASVMNAFFVPQLGSMINVMNAMTTHLNLQADQEGEFMGLSTMFSGDGFPGMHFTVKAVSDGDYAAWMRTAKSSGATLDRAAYDALAKQSLNAAPATFTAVEPDLFMSIVSQKIPPAEGPTQGGHTSADVSPRTGG